MALLMHSGPNGLLHGRPIPHLGRCPMRSTGLATACVALRTGDSPAAMALLTRPVKVPKPAPDSTKSYLMSYTMSYALQSTGLDPEGVALRASEGLAAVDFLMPGYFVWGKIIEALADIGYETNNLVRLSTDKR